jgi:hypothetical protein
LAREEAREHPSLEFKRQQEVTAEEAIGAGEIEDAEAGLA